MGRGEVTQTSFLSSWARNPPKYQTPEPSEADVSLSLGDKAPDLLSKPRAEDTKCLWEGVFLETQSLLCECVVCVGLMWVFGLAFIFF